MLREWRLILFIPFLIMSLSGCLPLLAGAAGGTGTAVWLSGKLTREFDSPFEECIEAVKTALESFDFAVTKETKKEEIAQIKSEYSDGKTIWVDIRKISPNSSRIDVRVGALSDEEAARQIMERVESYI
ncbi:MAG: DUF3568 family protein [Candidatus Omnitrophica bacterium]|nr:DUF3568 family protein [Candidatus Omnitrophota bacterium]MBD3269505.1 DUF3568 family protein [Candidatus Omnitrophota bacterium]